MTLEEQFEIKLQEHKDALVAQNWCILRRLDLEMRLIAKRLDERNNKVTPTDSLLLVRKFETHNPLQMRWVK